MSQTQGLTGNGNAGADASIVRGGSAGRGVHHHVEADSLLVAGALLAARPQRQERLRAQSRLRAQLSPLAALAHDARNVMGALQLYSELVAEPGVLSEKFSHYADEVQAITEAGSRLLQQISRLADAELSTSALQPPIVRLTEAGDLDELLSESPVENLAVAVRQMTPLLSAVTGPGVQLEVETLPCPGTTRISPEDLTRVLLNLVRNAADAMPRGGHVRVSVQQAGGGNFIDPSSGCAPTTAAALLCVQDDGPGMEPAVLERIFEPGFSTRSRSACWPKTLHRGFGLSIVKSLAESAGGQVRVFSTHGSGTRFEVELPLAGVELAKTATANPAGTNVTFETRTKPQLLMERTR